MANLLNNEFNNLRLELDMSEYWDFFINKDSDINDIDFSLLGKELETRCLSSFIDFSNENCVNDNNVTSLPEYIWEEAVNFPVISLENIGYTGLDNGLIPFKRDEVSNEQFLEIFQNSVYQLPYNNVLSLHPVDGGTKKYDYSLNLEKNRVKLNGGFYQGFFKTKCNEYQILPDKLNNGECWDLEFVLEKKEFEKNNGKTLNDKYPDNKGIFFYLGTRAENKWFTLYEDIKNEYDDSVIEDYIDLGNIQNPKDTFYGEMIGEPYEWESEAIDEYLAFKYYDSQLYDIEDHGLEDYFYENHKAVVIDETEQHENIICWCKCTEKPKTTKSIYKGCGCHNESINYNKIDFSDCSSDYLSKCTLFDLIDDVDYPDPDIDYIESEVDITDFEFKTKNGFSLKVKGQWFKEYTNPFLLYDRTCNGYTVQNYKEGDVVRYVGVNHKLKDNPFLLLNRTCTGYTATELTDLEETIQDEYDLYGDLYQNAFALRITDDGRVGYRYLIQDCDSEEGYSIKEGYSSEGIIKENEISVIHVRLKGFVNTMKLEFYVNGKLVFLTKEMPKINLRELKDLYEKQESVPFNLSLGGGTQGLIETILPNYMDDLDVIYPLEKNFAGTFIGYIYNFKFYSCCLNFFEILNNYKYEIKNSK